MPTPNNNAHIAEMKAIKEQLPIHLGIRRFTKKLKAAGIAHTYEEYDDDHMDVDYRLDVFLPLLAMALS